MHAPILAASLAFSVAGGMTGYVASRSEKSAVHWLLLGVLAAIMVWTAGSVARFSVHTVEGLEASLRILFLGVMATPPLWLLLAARYARRPALLARRDVALALALPSALAYLALLTNEGHHWLIREVSFASMRAGARDWAGPVFWAFIAWSYGCVLAGLALYLSTARRLVANDERERGLVLALAAAIPLLASSVYLFGWLPVTFDLTPSGLSISVVLISAAVFRYQLLENVPLARRDVIEHHRDGILIASARGAVLDLNPAAASLLGRSADQLRGLALARVLGDLTRGSEAAALGESLANLDVRRELLVAEVSTADHRQLEIRAACVRVGRGEPAGQFALLRDRTQERRNELRARRTERLETVATLAAGVAHEVNNPLAFVRANLAQIQRMGELVEARVGEPDAKLARELGDLPQIAAETLDGIARIERIVADMRRLSAPREERFAPVDLNDVVRDAIRLANLRDDPEVAVEVALARELPELDGSSERLAQALINLLVNARQATRGRPEARIRVETHDEGGAVAVCVLDNGPGIPADVQDRIFDPFFTTKPPDEGTGLGLPIAFDILRDHGGLLEVTSRPGEGTAFYARLPVR